MKKIISLVLVILLCCGGCGKKNVSDAIKTFKDKVNNAKSYVLKGNMEIYADEEIFSYSIEASYLKENFYKVIMVNKTNNHEQVLLRNADAVYVITPSLNKSFKFQSEWPDNSSQSYLLKPIVKDITNDTNASLEEKDGEYVVTSSVNYPNNPELKSQKVTLDKEGNLKTNEIYDDQNNVKMKVTFTSIDYNTSLKETDFALENFIQNEEESETKDTDNNTNKDNSKNDNTKKNSQSTCTEETCKEEKGKCEGDACDKETGVIEDILYPLYIPSNTYLSTSDKVNTDNGNRVILTFGGEKSFVLVEEKEVANEEMEIIPVYGDPLLMNDTIGALGANSLTWTKDNISYYLAGNDLSVSELLSIGTSIRTQDVTVSKEK